MTTGYQTIIGGTAVYPSNQTYIALTLSADTQLSWPIESVSSETIVADLMDITPINQNGWNLILPDATGGSNGITMIVSNLSGTYTFSVLDNTSNLVLSIAPGGVWLIYLTDNSTQAGAWRTFQYGAQAGSVNVAAIAGSGLLALGSSLNQSMPVSAKGTNYTVIKDDRASVILWTGAAGALTLPVPSGVGSNWFINIANKGTGALTVTPVSGLLDGAASKVFAAGTGSAVVFTDGSNYYTLGYGGATSTSGFDYTTINCAGADSGTGPITLAGGQLDRISYKLFGILTGNRSIIVPAGTQQYWIDNETSSSGGPYTMSIRTSGQTDPVGGVTVSQPGQAIMYCDGSNVRPATSGISLPVTVASGGTGATTAPLALTNLGGTATGQLLFTAPSANAALTSVLGGSAVGVALFTAANQSAALTAMATGTMTGAMGVTGVVTAGGIRVTATPSPIVGIYSHSAGALSFATGSVLAGYFGASDQHLNLTHALDITQGGTGAITLQGAVDALGDKTNTANTLAQRDAAANIFANYFRMFGAADNLALTNIGYDTGDGYFRRMTKANFATALSASIIPDSLSTASGTAPSYSARAFASFTMTAGGATTLSSGNVASITRTAAGQATVVFTTALPNANYAIVFGSEQVGGNLLIITMIRQTTTPTTTGFLIEVTNAAGAGDIDPGATCRLSFVCVG